MALLCATPNRRSTRPVLNDAPLDIYAVLESDHELIFRISLDAYGCVLFLGDRLVVAAQIQLIRKCLVALCALTSLRGQNELCRCRPPLISHRLGPFLVAFELLDIHDGSVLTLLRVVGRMRSTNPTLITALLVLSSSLNAECCRPLLDRPPKALRRLHVLPSILPR